MKRIQVYFAAGLLWISGCGIHVTGQENLKETPQKTPSYSFSQTLLWADEFETDGKPNTAIWAYDLGGGGWGNNEKQVYTHELNNARIENGVLIIEARKGSNPEDYTSARLISKNKKDFLYGRLEVKAKLPAGTGTWPAIWTLASQHAYGNNYWPDNGELDIMEHVGMDQDRIHANIHTQAFNHVKGTNKGNNRIVQGVSDEFHIYRLDWYPNSVQMFTDNQLLFQFDKMPEYSFAEWPFDKPQHLLMNIAIGGNWGGQKGIDDSIFPQQMQIDYVRYYPLIIGGE